MVYLFMPAAVRNASGVSSKSGNRSCINASLHASARLAPSLVVSARSAGPRKRLSQCVETR